MGRRKGSKNRKKANGDGESAPGLAEIERSPTTSHNANARRDILREVHVNLDAIEAEIATLRERANEERARVKALDIRMADFNAVRRLKKLEEDDKQKALDGLRESFEALMEGETVDWISATIEVRQTPEPVDTKTARAAGRQAGQAGKASSLNPHAEGSDQHKAWNEGHLSGMADNVKGAGDPFAETAH